MQDLSKKQQDSFLHSDARINIFEGPVRAGKSFVALLRWIDFCANGPSGPLIICGRTDKTIKRNIISPLQQLVGKAVVYKQGKGEVQLYNRTMYVVGANDDRAEAKIRGSEFAGALIDEATLIPENFFKMLLSRLSIPGSQLFCSTNPDSPYHWFKKDFIDREAELDLKVFSFDIHDNPSLSKKYIQDLSNEYQGLWHKRYIEGKWVLADGAVFDFFDEKIHIISMPTSPATYYIMGIDYGTTNPCVFVLIGYNPGAYPNMWLEKEYYYDSKETLRQKSDYEYVKDMEEFMDGYYVKQIYIDPSAASLKQEMVRNGIDRISDAKNDVLPGIRFMGQLLTNGTYKICAQCTHSIKEFSNYLWDSKASERGLDVPIKRFDHCFVAGTPVLTKEGPKPIESIHKGEYVLTRAGWNKVVDRFENQREVATFVVLGKEFTCTPDHKFITVEGKKEVRLLMPSDILYTELESLPWMSSLSLRESNIDAIKTLNMLVTAPTIEHINTIALEDMDICIETFGSTTMEKFHPDIIFITKTGIPLTTTLAISGVSQLVSIFHNMEKVLAIAKEKLEEIICTKSALLLKSGMEASRDERGIASMVNTPHLSESPVSLSVSVAGSFSQRSSKVSPTFVAITVKASGDEIITLMMRQESVLSAIKNLHATSMPKLSIAADRAVKEKPKVSRVYNLHVDSNHEYFANNILVMNSLDAQRYALFSNFFAFQGKGMTENDAEELERMYIKR